MLELKPQIIQYGSKKEPFRLIGINRGKHHNWYYLIKYIDTNELALLNSKNDKIIDKITNLDKIHEILQE